jgi:hypothetical protein
MQGPMLKALRRFTQLLRVHIYIPGCCKYIRMANGLQPLAELCMDGCCADKGSIPKQIFSLFKLLLLTGAWPDFLRLSVAA